MLSPGASEADCQEGEATREIVLDRAPHQREYVILKNVNLRGRHQVRDDSGVATGLRFELL